MKEFDRRRRSERHEAWVSNLFTLFIVTKIIALKYERL